jgi:uncharacterized protein involved in type VI secretion and phage assembly
MTVLQEAFHGKYRGVVVANEDPLSLGRLQVAAADVYGSETSGWALPAVPYAGDGVGLFLIPPVGALVWVEFEQGDPTYPIWTGCFWADGQLPADPAVPTTKVLKTVSATLTFDDEPGSASVTIETAGGMRISIDTDGISIDNGQGSTVTLSGPKVSVNDGALEVT